MSEDYESLKIKLFMRCFKRAVILTKDHLDKRNLNGSKLCCFCSKLETIQALFFEHHYAKSLCRVVHFVLGIQPPYSTNDLFNSWSKQAVIILDLRYRQEFQQFAWQFVLAGMDLRSVMAK